MPLLIDVFVAKESYKVQKQYDGMILSLGTSFEPLVLSIRVLKPDRVCFLFTEASREFLDPVVKFTGLSLSQCDSRLVDKDNPLQIYQAIKDIYREWGYPSNLALDFTGGTKAMSGGSAMAGGLIGAEMVYIASSKYLANLRRPFPGSEHLEFIPNPYQVFGDLEEEKAFASIAKYDYQNAYRIFAEIESQVLDPRRYHVLSLLCRTYDAWDNLDIQTARTNMAAVVEDVRRFAAFQKDFILAKKLPILELQLQALNSLNNRFSTLCKGLKSRKHKEALEIPDILGDREFVLALMFTLYCNARRREEQGKYDMASLLLYRLLELISQVRLAAYGLDTVLPDYALLPQGLDELLAKINAKSEKCKNIRPMLELPEQISLLAGYLILAGLEDELALSIHLDRLQGQVAARNSNIFAHGFDFIDASTCHKFRELVDSVFGVFLSIWKEDMSKLYDRYKFIKKFK